MCSWYDFASEIIRLSGVDATVAPCTSEEYKDVYKRQGQILYDEAQMREIYEHGRGSVKVRARYNVVPGENMIEITQIPPTTCLLYTSRCV